ncbi:alpha-2-macroglobulin receptor-associated protein [Erinaceus europaeus]|uniref:Alpha-2-macroglobulin receptor-associated protein n=1 Tax=Erinaceus europaeus TaxID=9365 RepID=A0A1S3WTE9_ERIEU|nr:alpha-2-macroglobulin receptor-associated protein [Erinaceus europaeus]
MAAPALLLLLFLRLLGPGPAAAHGGKYSREKNEPAPAVEFRMEKLSQLWEKAQRLQLPSARLWELHADLKLQERDEFRGKRLQAEGRDLDGQEEARLSRQLHVLVAKYGLDGRKDAGGESSNAIDDTSLDTDLEDPRLEKLWHKAKTSGKFSSEELARLWREFVHHRDKAREYSALLDALSRTEEMHENLVGPLDGGLPEEEALRSRHADLKDRLRSLNQGFDRLHKVSHQGYGAQPDEFEEPRVLELWEMAQAANFTPKELEAFREELRHFEARVDKHSHYQKQLQLSLEKLQHAEGLGDRGHVSRSRERHAQLQEKTRELGYKVKKHLQDLSGRVSRTRHQEL